MATRVYEGQKWTHKSYGGEFEVAELSGGMVRLRGTDERAFSVKMYVEQLPEHYKPLNG